MSHPHAVELNTRATRSRLVFEGQRRAALAEPYPRYEERRSRLLQLKQQLQRYQDVLPVAIAEDFGWRAPVESKLIDVMAPVLEIRHTLSKLRRWMKPRRRSPELLFATNSLKVTYQPKGVVGIIVPWNFPLFLAISPLTTALAAGNRVMIKMPRACPATTRALRQMLGEIFSEDLVAVIAADEPDSREFSKLPFNHIVFTGSPDSGKDIMANAAANLTPVTLELGGKSPAIVSRPCSIKDAAKRIAHGKAFNSGQICVAPDYAMVPEESLQAFVVAVKDAFLAMHARTEGSEDYTSIINAKQQENFYALLADAETKGALIIRCGPESSGAQQPLRIVTGVTEDMLLAQQEIFGPILMVLTYQTIDQAINYMVRRPRPLALYCFGHDKAERQQILRDTHSGGVTINDWGWHCANFDAPFGGVGNSGMGTYHGVEGFRELSHTRTVFKRHRFYPIGLFYPPYGTKVQQWVFKLLLGKSDPTVQLLPSGVETPTPTAQEPVVEESLPVASSR
jgi:coniferyl-aldehyde dehydrogenase